MNLISLLGKKGGDTRCIAVATTLYRLVMALLKPEIRAWDLRVGTENDSALSGRQPLLETIKRAADMEAASRRGDTVIAILWDAAKFFDSLDIPTLAKRALELGFPKDLLVLGLQIHRAPRVFKALGTCTELHSFGCCGAVGV